MEIKDIEKLAKLARIELTEVEKASYLKDISAILAYVDQIQEVVSRAGQNPPQQFSPFNGVPNHSENVLANFGPKDLKNVMRADDNENKSGDSTESLVAEFPRKEGDYLKVKKILEQ